MAQPVHTTTCEMRGGGPDRPEVGGGPEADLLGGKRPDRLGQAFIRESPSFIEWGDVLQLRVHVFIVITPCRRSSAWLEQRSFKPNVRGSNPRAGTNPKFCWLCVSLLSASRPSAGLSLANRSIASTSVSSGSWPWRASLSTRRCR